MTCVKFLPQSNYLLSHETPSYGNGNHVASSMFMLCVHSNLNSKCVEEVMDQKNIYLTKVCEQYLATNEGKKRVKGVVNMTLTLWGMNKHENWPI